jgi:hypothetical protein
MAPLMGGSAMKSQIIAVAIAFVAGFAIELLTQSAGVISMGDNASLSNFIGNVVGYWTVMLSSLPVIFVVIAILATARKAGLRNSILTGLGAVVGVFGFSFLLIYGAIAFGTTYPRKEIPLADAGKFRNSFVKGVSGSCAQREKAHPENKDVPAAAIDALCSCFANSLADAATRADIVSFGLHETTPSLAEKLKAASEKCMRLVQRQP